MGLTKEEAFHALVLSALNVDDGSNCGGLDAAGVVRWLDANSGNADSAAVGEDEVREALSALLVEGYVVELDDDLFVLVSADATSAFVEDHRGQVRSAEEAKEAETDALSENTTVTENSYGYVPSSSYGYGCTVPPAAPSTSSSLSSSSSLRSCSSGLVYDVRPILLQNSMNSSDDHGWRNKTRRRPQPKAKYRQKLDFMQVSEHRHLLCVPLEFEWNRQPFSKYAGWVGGVIIDTGWPKPSRSQGGDWSMSVTLSVGAVAATAVKTKQSGLSVVARLFAKQLDHFPLIRKTGDLLFLSSVTLKQHYAGTNNDARHFVANVTRSEVIVMDRDTGPYACGNKCVDQNNGVLDNKVLVLKSVSDWCTLPRRDAVVALNAQAVAVADSSDRIGCWSYLESLENPLRNIQQNADVIVQVSNRCCEEVLSDGATISVFRISDNCQPPTSARLVVQAECLKRFRLFMGGFKSPWVRFRNIEFIRMVGNEEQEFFFSEDSAAIIVFTQGGLRFSQLEEFLPAEDVNIETDTHPPSCCSHNQSLIAKINSQTIAAIDGVTGTLVNPQVAAGADAAAGTNSAAEVTVAAAAEAEAEANTAANAIAPTPTYKVNVAGENVALIVEKPTDCIPSLFVNSCSGNQGNTSKKTVASSLISSHSQSKKFKIAPAEVSDVAAVATVAEVLKSIGESPESALYTAYVKAVGWERNSGTLLVRLEDISGYSDAITYNCVDREQISLFTRTKQKNDASFLRVIVRGSRVDNRDMLDVLQVKPVADVSEVLTALAGRLCST